MKKLLMVLFLALLCVPNLKAEYMKENEEILVSETTRYYKTTYYNNNLSLIQLNTLDNNYETIEISKEEYENANVSLIKPNTVMVETTYKKLTSQIIQVGDFYRYKAELTWKNIPSKRSYDIIGIGFNSNVKPNNSPVFQMTYCTTNGRCTTSSTNSPQIFKNGVGTSFKLPEGDLSSLSSTLTFNVIKVNDVVTSQFAAADYSHATSTITQANAKNYSVSEIGITLNGINSYYDSMSSATSYWNGTW